MQPIFFATQLELRKWLQKNFQTSTELIVGFYKVGSNKKTMTWSQSVDEALCFGWIDGIRKSIDDCSYQIRFTPRKTNSVWSAVNVTKVNELIKTGLMQDAGLRVFNLRKEEHLVGYTFNKEVVKFSKAFEKIFASNIKAWAYFQNLALSYQNPSVKWVMSAKQETTQLKRLQELIADSENETNKWKYNKYKK